MCIYLYIHTLHIQVYTVDCIVKLVSMLMYIHVDMHIEIHIDTHTLHICDIIRKIDDV